MNIEQIKNTLREFQAENRRKFKNTQAKFKKAVSYKKKVYLQNWPIPSRLNVPSPFFLYWRKRSLQYRLATFSLFGPIQSNFFPHFVKLYDHSHRPLWFPFMPFITKTSLFSEKKTKRRISAVIPLWFLCLQLMLFAMPSSSFAKEKKFCFSFHQT